MDRNSIVNKHLNSLLDDVEGYSSEVYEDHKGIPTIGHGVSLRSPSSKQSLLRMGYAPEQVESGEVSLKPEELAFLRDDIVNEKRNLFNNIKDQSFPKKELNEAQEAALLSLTYNSPQLLGPNLRQHLNENRDLDVIREIILNSNREKSPGMQLRRMKEAELYGGPLDFNMLVKTLKPEEKKQVYELLSQIENEEQRNQVLQKYGQFNPEDRPQEKPKFYKIANILKGN